MNLLKVLFISWLIGAGLSFCKGVDVSYQAKCLFMSASYMLAATSGYYYLLKELKLKKSFDFYVISALCVCMVVSSWFNYVFINIDVYYSLLDSRTGDGFSWKNIYRSVEIVALLVVGKNGFIYINNWVICRRRRFNAIIEHNSTYNSGK